MVVRVARRVHCAEGGAVNAERLIVDDGLLGFAGGVFVDGSGKVGVFGKEVGDTAGVVAVPVG